MVSASPWHLVCGVVLVSQQHLSSSALPQVEQLSMNFEVTRKSTWVLSVGVPSISHQVYSRLNHISPLYSRSATSALSPLGSASPRYWLTTASVRSKYHHVIISAVSLYYVSSTPRFAATQTHAIWLWWCFLRRRLYNTQFVFGLWSTWIWKTSSVLRWYLLVSDYDSTEAAPR